MTLARERLPFLRALWYGPGMKLRAAYRPPDPGTLFVDDTPAATFRFVHHDRETDNGYEFEILDGPAFEQFQQYAQAARLTFRAYAEGEERPVISMKTTALINYLL